MTEVIQVKALNHNGDWFLIPNELSESFYDMTDKFNDVPDKISEDIYAEFEEIFGQYRTEGDLNNVQLHIMKQSGEEVEDILKIPLMSERQKEELKRNWFAAMPDVSNINFKGIPIIYGTGGEIDSRED